MLCLLLLGAMLIREEGVAQDVHYGIKGGFAMATLNGDATSDSGAIRDATFRPALSVGIFANAIISGDFGIHLEVNYAQKGGKGKGLNPYEGNEEQDMVFKFDYVEIPLYLKYYLNEGIHADIGGYFGVMLAGNRKFGKLTEDISESLQNTDYGMILGLGYELPNTSVSVELKYTQGLQNIANDEFITEKYYNGVLSLTIGYAFH